jgi:hypothetical protein
MDANKAAAISKMILAKVAEGMELRAAFDAVLGHGAYERLASDLFDTLRANG